MIPHWGPSSTTMGTTRMAAALIASQVIVDESWVYVTHAARGMSYLHHFYHFSVHHETHVRAGPRRERGGGGGSRSTLSPGSAAPLAHIGFRSVTLPARHPQSLALTTHALRDYSLMT